MESEPSIPTINSRSRSLAEAIRDEQSDASSSTPSATTNAIHRQELSFTMPSTPEELENMFAERIAAMNLASSITPERISATPEELENMFTERIAAMNLASSITPERISIAASSGFSIASSSARTIPPRIMPQEVPRLLRPRVVSHAIHSSQTS